MRAFWGIFRSYLEYRRGILAVLVGCYVIFLTVFFLYSQPLETVVYAILLTLVFITVVTVFDVVVFYRKHRALSALRNKLVLTELELPHPQNLIERDYQQLIALMGQKHTELITQQDKTLRDMIDYYTIWVHQIKTPIAAMNLLLQAEKSEQNSELLDQLFRIERYVEMVLQYLRLESLNSDLVLNNCPLDDIVRQAIRKYSKVFIRQRIRLNYSDLNCEVLTDPKWLTFVVEQVLSNALKYTPAGEISIYMDPDLPKTLVIEDTGIGIEAEDLPRVFDRGFTGYNGRLNQKSTGIGLYLCRRILSKLSHTMVIESAVNQGTKVKIGLESAELNVQE